MPADNTASTVLGSKNVTNVSVTSGFQNGWASLTFTGAGSIAGLSGVVAATSQRIVLGTAALPAPGTIAVGAATFFGLPVTGFMVRTFSNNTLTCGTASCQGNYGAAFRHSYVTNAAP
jgi:hypothetical protein